MNDEKYTYHSPPAHGPLDQEWIALEEDIAALTDYFIAALEGNESKSTLRRMWKQETDIIRSRRRKSECGACTGPDPLDDGELFRLIRWAIMFRDKNNRLPTGAELRQQVIGNDGLLNG